MLATSCYSIELKKRASKMCRMKLQALSIRPYIQIQARRRRGGSGDGGKGDGAASQGAAEVSQRQETRV
jgi:hypothetical protein